MATLCLVHGSAQNSEGWDLLAPELQRLGHKVLRAELTKGITDLPIQHYVGEILQACAGESEVVVAGTSMAGVFLPLAAADTRVTQIIYIAAMIPTPGVSPMEQVRGDASMFNPAWIGKNPVADPQVARDFLFHDCSPAIQEWALRTLALMVPRRALGEALRLSTWPEKPRAYIVCEEDRTIQPAWSRRAAREILHVEALELPGGHCPHVSRPAELASVLHRIICGQP